MNINEAIAYSIKNIKESLPAFTTQFKQPQSKDYVYEPIISPDYSWTEGFWTGMIWLAYELTNDETFKDAARIQVELFRERLDKKYNIDNHDMGFLYTLSCVAAYKITGDTRARETAIMSANHLFSRYREKGEFIQAWGDISQTDNYRLIIDCLMNIPLLYWASEETNNPKYAEVAKKHLNTSLKVLLRDDFTTMQTYYFDPETGAPLRGAVHQAYDENSCWSRGQAWIIYGSAISYAYTKDQRLIDIFKGVTKAFIDRLPTDYVAYWDLVFTNGDQPRDTSAAATAVCGILEMARYIDIPEYVDVAEKILSSLTENYLTCNIVSNGLLTDGMYSLPHGDKPECTIWGDYFYMEALTRMKKTDWKMYW